MAAKNERDLIVRIIGDARQMKKATKEAESGISAFQDRVGQAGTAIAAAFAGGAILNFAKQSISAALEDARAQERLAKTLENVVQANKDQVAAVEQSIAAMQSQFAVADDELRPAFETLVRATKDVGQAQRLMQLALDISAGSGKSLQDVSVALVKAMGGQTRSLRDLGIQIKDTQGKTLSFNDIVAQLSATFSGQAAEAADSESGRLKALAIQYDELKETVGSALLPVLSQLADVAGALFGWFAQLDEGTQKIIAQMVVFSAAGIAAVKAFTAVKAAVVGMAASTAAAQGTMLGLSTTMGGVVAVLGLATAAYALFGRKQNEAKVSTEDFTFALQDASTAIEEDIVNALLKVEGIDVLMDKAGISAGQAADYITGRWKPTNQQISKNIESMELFIHTLGPLRAEFIKYNEKAAITERLNADLGASTAGLVGPMQAAEGSTKSYQERLEDFAKQLYSTGKQASQTAQEIINAVDDIRAEFDVDFKVNKLKKDVKDGLKSLADDLKGLKKDSDQYNLVVQERIDKELELAQALADQQTQGRKLSETELAIERNQTMINYFAGVLRTLDPNSPMRKYLTGFIEDLLKINGTYDARINVVVAGMPGIAEFDKPGNNFGLTQDQIEQIVATIKPKRRAMGGPVTSGRPYIVGEEGPELFVPGANGQIIPNGAGAGGPTNITVNVTAPAGTDPYSFGNAIVSALKSYVRVNGKIAGLTV